MGDSAELVAGRLRAALQLCQAGITIQRQNLRRAHPKESAEQIQQRLQEWLLRDSPPDDPALVVRTHDGRFANHG